MKKPKFKSTALNFIILLVAAVMLSLPFCNEKLFGVAWCSLSVLIYSIYCRKMTLKRVFCSLFCFFYLFYFCIYSWFVNLYPLDFAGLGKAESIVVILCGVLLIPLLQSALMGGCTFLGYFVSQNSNSFVIKSVSFSCAYVLGEYLQNFGTFAFPWAKLALTQTGRLEFLQSAGLFGSYFVSFIIVVVNCLLAFFVYAVRKRDKKRATCMLVFAAMILLCDFAYGRYEMTKQENEEKINVLVLQGNVASGEKWKDDADHKSIYYDLSYKAKEIYEKNGIKPDITLVPETAFPVTLLRNGKIPYSSKDDAEILFEISKLLDTTLFAGAFFEEGENTYNSVYAITSDQEISKPYNKHNIVPFGEFLPYRKLLTRVLPFFEDINMLSSDISRGNDYTPVDAGKVKAGVLVCFDSIFEKTARLQVKNGADIILVSTNDSWYKTSAALYQHARHSILRAIENKVCVVRSANTGISLVADRCGRIVDKTQVNQRTYIKATVDISEQGSMYTRIGNVFVCACFVWMLLILIVKTIKNSRTKAREI